MNLCELESIMIEPCVRVALAFFISKILYRINARDALIFQDQLTLTKINSCLRNPHKFSTASKVKELITKIRIINIKII